MTNGSTRSRTRLAKAVAFLLVLTLLFSLTGCGTKFSPTQYVQSLLDVTYRNDATVYLQMVDSTEEEAAAAYEQNLAYEADYFLAFFGIGKVSDAVQKQIVDLYKSIYAKSSYSVSEAVQDGASYQLTVTVNPIDIITRNYSKIDEALQLLVDQSADAEYASETAFNDALAKAAVAILQDQVSSISYESEISVNVVIAQDAQKMFGVDDNALAEIDAAIISYDYP